MTVLPSMGLTLPTRGPSGAGLWGDTDDANLALIDTHNHAFGQGDRVPTAGVNINADLPFGALWAPTQLHRVQFSAIAGAALTGGQRLSLFVSDGTGGLVANELYYLTNLGASIRFTNGSALNVGTFSGTIGGDYGSVGAQLNYTDSSKTYDFKESTVDSHGWARVQCGGLRLIEFNTTETFFVAHNAPAALGASYSLAWPTALPGANGTLLQSDNAGNLSFANTSLDSVTLAANANVTVSGTGDFKHGTRTLPLTGAAFAGSGTTKSYNRGSVTIASATSEFLLASIPLTTGARINTIRVYVHDSSTGPSTVTATFFSVSTTGTVTVIGTPQTSAGNNTDQTLTMSALATTVTAGASYGLEVKENSASGTTVTIYKAEIDYDRP